MTKALIVEDEKLAAEHLQMLLNQAGIDIEVVGLIPSIEEAVTWFACHPMPELLFLDIQLSDGLSFEIFDHVNITCPVIFTTAYEEYALKAFKVNSIDYLLKPVHANDLIYAIEQYRKYNSSYKEVQSNDLKYRVDNIMKMLTNTYKSRFVVNVGIHIKSIEVDNISYFYSLEKATFIYENKGKNYDVNYSLEQIEKLVDPKLFFRISRKYVVNIHAIADIISFSNSRMKLIIANSNDNEIIVSRSKLTEFRKWLEK
jgi:DNA-binding LytR/AlgR family response regulator